MGTLTIGQVARAAGVGVETVRFYERTGLLAPPPRTPAGYRQYPPQVVTQLGFIRQAQRLGFTLTEIADLLALHQVAVPCADVKARAAAKVAAIEEKVGALRAVQGELLALMARCDAVCRASCCTALFPTMSCGDEERTPT